MCICCTLSDFGLYIVALMLPPVAVLFRSGIFSIDLLLNILLTLLGIAPGIVHAFYYVYTTSAIRLKSEVLCQQGYRFNNSGSYQRKEEIVGLTENHGHKNGKEAPPPYQELV